MTAGVFIVLVLFKVEEVAVGNYVEVKGKAALSIVDDLVEAVVDVPGRTPNDGLVLVYVARAQVALEALLEVMDGERERAFGLREQVDALELFDE